jgi:pimeloyl-ACP methyl ester carboxylesterase
MATIRHAGTVLTDHTFVVPLDHDEPDGERIEVYGREVVAADKAGEDGLPWLLFLQGGPGMAASRPFGREGWLGRALEDYRVLLLDQRGTGLSTPANRQTLARLGGAKEQADYLAHFRADAIARDAEAARRALLGDEPWSVLGQSFGGFCIVSYLSFAPEGVREAFITGGLPGLDATADDWYRLTYPRVVARNAAYYERYPDDVDIVRRVAGHLRDREVRLPGGGSLTVEAFQSLGRLLGASTGGDQLHYLLEYAFASGPELSDAFLSQVEGLLSFAAAPLYALLHEPSFAQGHKAPRWSAQRIRAEFPQLDATAALARGAPVLFTGEMIYPWTLDTDPALRPLREVAELLADREFWPDLHDVNRLRLNQVPVAAAVYYDDMYVPFELSMETARTIRALRPWVTNEWEHDGLRASNGAVLDRLISMVRGIA